MLRESPETPCSTVPFTASNFTGTNQIILVKLESRRRSVEVSLFTNSGTGEKYECDRCLVYHGCELCVIFLRSCETIFVLRVESSSTNQHRMISGIHKPGYFRQQVRSTSWIRSKFLISQVLGLTRGPHTRTSL